ncbi:hypothetical protein FKW77_001064 [Venturia effusa]|uniref:Uncharacterized protein n=1 Tax=Venturia effusa TaxID=50376 RepID=A0A517LJL2_9PEZI|nr:hypothetical protein FKW77_001064 [Venturia effusa]
MRTQTSELLSLDLESAMIKVKISYLQEILKANAFYAADRICLEQTLGQMGKEKLKIETKLVEVEEHCRRLAGALRERGDKIQSLEHQNMRLNYLVANMEMQIPEWIGYEDARDMLERGADASVSDESLRLDSLLKAGGLASVFEASQDPGHDYEQEFGSSEEDGSEMEYECNGELKDRVEKRVLNSTANLHLAECRLIDQGEIGKIAKPGILTNTPRRSSGPFTPSSQGCGNSEIPLTPRTDDGGAHIFQRQGESKLPPTPVSMDSKLDVRKTALFETGAPIPFLHPRVRDTDIQDKQRIHIPGNMTDTEGLDDDVNQRSISSSGERHTAE